MKTLKEYAKQQAEINEGLIRKQAGMSMEAKIEYWISDMCSRNILDFGPGDPKGKYTINEDMTITCKHQIYFMNYDEEQLPDYIQFNEVKAFIVEDCPKLKNLRGFPKSCSYKISIEGCPQLETLEGDLSYSASCYIKNCPKLKNLKGAPEVSNSIFNGQFWVQGCDGLTSLEGAPKRCVEFRIDHCPSLKNLKGIPKNVTQGCYLPKNLVLNELGVDTPSLSVEG